jgi:polar amino acid transport system substrate-binding protein
MKVEFQLIEWGNKFAELNSRAITAIWNGFTATANEPDGTPRINLCDMSFSYMTNTQAVVVRANRVGEFRSRADLTGKTVAVEAGSAGETKAKGLVGDNGRVVGAPAQIHTFMEVMSGAVDAAIIDIILAQQLAGRGDYAALAVANIPMDAEVYAIGFSRGDPLRDRVNAAMVELYNEGKLTEIARKFGLEERLVLDRTFGR